MSKFTVFYDALDNDNKQAFAQRANLKARYIQKHLLKRTKKPSFDTIVALANASDSHLTPHDILDHFLDACGVAE